MIEFCNVWKRYGDKTAVRDLSLRIDNGTTCVLIGPSGCGKSTTLRMINRLHEPDDGYIWVDDVALRDYNPARLRLRVGYVIQSVGLLPHLKVWQNIALVPRLLGWDTKRRRARAAELLELVELDPSEQADKYPRQLSGGEAQRVGVARALAADPPYLLMDEPFGAVDPRTRAMLQRSFRDIQKRLKKTVVLVTHDLDEAIYLGDTIAIMNAGALRQHGSAAEILAEPADEFVRDFVGSDRMLRMLRTVDLPKLTGERRSATAADRRRAERGEGALFAHGATLKDAMASLLAAPGERVDIVFADGTVAGLDFAAIRGLITA